MSDLSGRRVVITGASSGIGAATARLIAELGGVVGLVARRQEPLSAFAGELGVPAHVAAADVTDTVAIRDAVNLLAERMGGIDGLVNSAGIYRPGLLSEFDIADVQAMFDINVVGLVAATQAALPHLRTEPHADLVNVSSMSGRRVPSAKGALYSASKFAVHAISQGLRLELADTSIRTTVIAPGYVNTPLGDELEGADGAEFRDNLSSLGMAPESVAAAIVGALAAPADSEQVEIAIMPRRSN